MKRPLPPTASVAMAAQGAKLHAPAAERNAAALTDVIRRHAPDSGAALEIASGTGQHVVAFARAMPGLAWQPTDVEPARLASIDAHAAEAGLPNLRPAQALDATRPGWSADHPGQSLIVLVNLLHLISAAEARTVVREAALALAPGGVLALYGPFKRGGALTSEGDARFDAELRAADPQIGYKDAGDVASWIEAAGLGPVDRIEMPANNLVLISRRPG